MLTGELTSESDLLVRLGCQWYACVIWRIVVLWTDWANHGWGSIKSNLGHIKEWFSLFKTQIHQYLSSGMKISREEGMAAHVSQLYFFWILPSLWGFLTVYSYSHHWALLPAVTTFLLGPRMYQKASFSLLLLQSFIRVHTFKRQFINNRREN